MIVENVTVINALGLHARPAAEFIKCAKRIKSKISIRRLDRDIAVDAKSIVSILTQAIGMGTEIEIIAEGEDEKLAAETLVALIQSTFDEE